MRMVAQGTVDRSTAEMWSMLADYANDSRWRRGVITMDSQPPGIAEAGTRTAEQLRFGGRIWRNDGEVVAVTPGTRLAWRTTSGVAAQGVRSVEPAGAGRSLVRLEIELRPHGTQEKLFVLTLGWLLRRNLRGDLDRLRRLAEVRAAPA